MIALDLNEQGKYEILGFSSYDNESKSTWIDFLKSFKKLGLSDVMMITSNAHKVKNKLKEFTHKFGLD